MIVDNETKLLKLYPKFANTARLFLSKCVEADLNGGIFMGYRSYQEQDALYAQGRTKPGSVVTNAKGGQSYHQFGLAFDYVFVNEKGWTWTGDYDKIGEIATSCGLEWGGFWQFKDAPHVQNRYGEDNNPSKLDAIYRQNLKTGAPLHAVWNYLNSKQV